MTVMLEELDHLEQRIRTLVERTQELGQECVTLRQEVAALTSERDAFVSQLAAGEAELAQLRQSVGQAESHAQQEKRKSQEEVARLQGTLDLFVVKKDAVEADLKTRDEEVLRLREVTRQAQARIDGVLERLPGAPVQEQL